MSNKLTPENPPAFPFVEPPTTCNLNPGMTLRDWFAGQALQGLLASGPHDINPREYAQDSYEYADAMLAARQEGARHE